MVAIVLGESGQEELEASVRGFEVLFSSGLLEAEVRSALFREGFPWSDPNGFPTVIEWVVPQRPLSQEITRALEVGHLRGADLWHIASALFVRESSRSELAFLTLDEPQRRVASELGFDTSAVG
jgi:hypothetical protein